MTEQNRLQQDGLSRQRIAHDIDCNFFVEASAGSGKTTALVKRMTAMVRAGADVRKICAITFTKAAANEFFMRFQRSLAACAQDHSLTGAERERCERALLDIDLCFMGTIDSFCHMILSEHPNEAGMVLDARILSEEERPAVYRREWFAAKRGEYGKDFDAKYAIFRRYQSRPDEVFDAAIAHFMDTREMHRPYDPAPDMDIDAAFARERAALVSICEGILQNPQAVNRSKDSQDKLQVLQRRRGVFSGTWDGNADRVLGLMSRIDGMCLTLPPEDIGIRHGDCFEPPKNKRGLYTLNICGEGSAYLRLREAQYSAAVAVLEAFAKEAAVRLKATGELSFFDYLLYLRNLLREDAAQGGRLIQHIHERHSYFLIDEFQDTNPMQAEIFFYLTARDPVPDWKACVPRPGSLFIVGDPKQSIYRFRGADVSAFLRVKAMFRGQVGEVLYLYNNFRSTGNMCTWFNATFEALMPEESEYQSRFDGIPLEGGEESAGFGGVYRMISSRDSEAEDVATAIESLINDESALIPESNLPGAPLRRISWGDIMVITWAKKAIEGLMSELTARGIPFRAEGKTAFSDCPAFAELCRITGAMAAPMGSAAIYAALKGSAFRIPDAELLAWREGGKRLTLLEPGDGPVGEALFRLSQARMQICDLPPCAAAKKALELFEVFEHAGTDNSEYVFFALELLRQAEVSGEVSTLPEAAAFLNRLLGNALERGLALSERKEGVHVANLHKVKGLEAPVVILSGINKRSRGPEHSVAREDAGELCHTFQISKAMGPVYAQTYKYADAFEKESGHLHAEEVRLLYVAATRAKNALIVLTNEKVELATNTWREFALRASDYTPEVHSAGEQISPSAIDLEAASAELAARAEKTEAAKAESFSTFRPSTLKVKSKTSAEDEYGDLLSSEMERASRRRHAALIGTVAHRMMECIVSSNDGFDEDGLAAELVSEYGLYGDAAGQIGELIRNAARRMRNGGYPQNNGLPADILAELKGAEAVYCEVPFCLRTEAAGYLERGLPTIWNGVMDLVYCKGGAWHIIDYKTNADPDDLDGRYQEQLKAYWYAFEQMTGCIADAKVYHLDV